MPVTYADYLKGKFASSILHKILLKTGTSIYGGEKYPKIGFLEDSVYNLYRTENMSYAICLMIKQMTFFYKEFRALAVISIHLMPKV